VFAQRVSGRDHWYGNFGHYCDDSPYTGAALLKRDGKRFAFGEGGRLCRLNLRTGRLQILLDDRAAGSGSAGPLRRTEDSVLVPSGRFRGVPLYEIDIDGGGLRQLTDGPDNDIEPTYTPDGGIVFCSSRCHRFVPCWRTQVATLYRCDADGRTCACSRIMPNRKTRPGCLPEGRVLYTRWEYVDRNQLLYHHLWTVNPDGSGLMVYFGNQHPGIAMLDAKPIPGGGKVVACFSPGHGREEHVGAVTVVDPRLGPMP